MWPWWRQRLDLRERPAGRRTSGSDLPGPRTRRRSAGPFEPAVLRPLASNDHLQSLELSFYPCLQGKEIQFNGGRVKTILKCARGAWEPRFYRALPAIAG